jgi:hypothetical protein
MQTEVVCASCGDRVAQATTDLVPFGTGFRCQRCSNAAVLEEHEVAHRSARGLLFPAVVGLLAGLIIGLNRGGADWRWITPLAMATGAAAGAGLRLGFHRLAGRLGHARAWIGGALYGLATLVTAVVAGAPLGVGLFFAIPITVSFGLQYDPDSVDASARQAVESLGLGNRGRAAAVVSIAVAWRQLLIGVAILLMVIGVVMGLIFGVDRVA